MTDHAALRAAAAEARAAEARADPRGLPRGEAMPCGLARRKRPPFSSELRAQRLVKRDGQDWHLVEGYASVVERAYEMWDWIGPYMEIVSAGAFDVTLKADPDVIFRFGHGGTTMARTTNGRLELWADETGLGDRAWLNPARDDVKQLVTAIGDRDVTEQSFMFSIVSGQWSPDYAEYRINEVDLDRGDVGPVTYGANPNTTVATRQAVEQSGDVLAALPYLPLLAAREAASILAHRTDLAQPAPPADRTGTRELARVGRSLELVLAELALDED